MLPDIAMDEVEMSRMLLIPRLREKGVKWQVVVDGQPGIEYDGISDVVFSHDGRRVAFAATRGGRTIVVIDKGGVIYDPQGLDREELLRLVRNKLDSSSFNPKKLSAKGKSRASVALYMVSIPIVNINRAINTSDLSKSLYKGLPGIIHSLSFSLLQIYPALSLRVPDRPYHRVPEIPLRTF